VTGMLSTIVFCEDRLVQTGGDSAVLLARTLAVLVSAKVCGVLCDVRIAGPARADLGLIASHAGCALVECDGEADRLRLSLEAARGPNIFLLRCGMAPEAGFIDEANDYLSTGGSDRAAVMRETAGSLLERLFPSLAPVAAIIGSRDLMLRAPCSSFQKLSRNLGLAATFRTKARRIR
jgi:hypothetical protein